MSFEPGLADIGRGSSSPLAITVEPSPVCFPFRAALLPGLRAIARTRMIISAAGQLGVAGHFPSPRSSVTAFAAIAQVGVSACGEACREPPSAPIAVHFA